MPHRTPRPARAPGPPRPATRPRRSPAHLSRDAMLDAAEEVVIRRGIGRLTLDAVAREAGLSKSGLLHHFPSKHALVHAMVERKVSAWRAHYTESIERQPPGPGRVPRAVLGTCLASADKWTHQQRRSSLVLVAALVDSPAHIQPLRDARHELNALLAGDGLPPGVGDAVLLAVDGLWFDWIFGITDLTPARLAKVRAALQRLVDLPSPTPPANHRRPGAANHRPRSKAGASA